MVKKISQLNDQMEDNLLNRMMVKYKDYMDVVYLMHVEDK
jgi:hypothetical protein